MRVFKSVAVAAILVFGIAACSESDGGGSSDGVEGRTIGVVHPVSSSEILDRQASAIEMGADALGWDVSVKRGESSPQRWGADIQTFASQKVDAIIIIGFDPTTVAPQIAVAQKAGIPVIQTVVAIDDDSASLVDGHYDNDYENMGQVLGEYTVKKVPGAVAVAQDLSVAPAVQTLNNAFGDAVKAGGGAGIVDRIDLSLGEPVVQAYGKNLMALLNSNSNANVYIAGADNALPSLASTFSQVNRNGLLYVSSYQNPSTLSLIQSGVNGAVVAVNQDRTAFEALDVLAAKFNDGTEIPKTYPGDEQKTAIVDSSNIAQGDPFPTDAEAATWIANWKSEYNLA
jgi:ABC-type sugar transport system substrate-binding protein